jgi:hypothetical protein
VSTRIQVRGFAELAAGTRMLAGRIEDGANNEAFVLVANRVADQVAGALPKRSGALAASAQGDQPAAVSMGEGVPYARFVEYGGRGHPRSAQGNYLYPIAMAAEPALVNAGQEVAAKEIRRMTWPRP